MIIKQLHVDLWQKILQPITVVQHEASGRTLAITLTGGGLPVNLTGCDVIFYAQKPDENILFNNCVIVDEAAGQVEYTITEQTVVLAGTLKCWIVVIKDGATIRSQEFHITVQESPDFTEAVESTSEFSDLEEALALVSGHEARITAAEGDIDGLDTRLTAAEEDIDAAEGKIGDLENAQTVLKNARARAFLSATQGNLVSTEWTKVLLNAETYDPGNNFDSTTNHMFVVPVDGYYLIRGQVGYTGTVANKYYNSAIYVNGSSIAMMGVHTAVVATVTPVSGSTAYLTAGQYVELYARHGAGVDTVGVVGGTTITYLEIALLAAA